MPGERKYTYREIVLSVAEEHNRRFWLTALTIGTFWFGYYFFAEVWPALLGAGSG